MNLMRIGELAAQAEVNIQTLRFYEREGLLRKPMRTTGGYRDYELQDFERVTFIRVCQSLGFTLREIEQLIQLHRVMADSKSGAILKPRAVEEIRVLAQERIVTIEEKIGVLSRMRSDLIEVASALASPASAICPVSTTATSSRNKFSI
ncbi:MAG: MerR family transcriptional regulator [Acidobacteriota bacterium]|nr:MerR family transcriptional regulator [Acidobacteriota bacterium]